MSIEEIDRREWDRHDITLERGKWKVTRWRTTHAAGITARRVNYSGTDTQVIEFEGEGYEQDADSLADLLRAAVAEHCPVPDREPHPDD